MRRLVAGEAGRLALQDPFRRSVVVASLKAETRKLQEGKKTGRRGVKVEHLQLTRNLRGTRRIDAEPS